jgi:hypothetical protein
MLCLLSLNALTLGHEHRRDRSSRAVGVLLRPWGRPFCTATVVPSPRGNLIVTAAHCLARTLRSSVMFAPGYRDHRAPLGEWRVTGQAFAPGWFPHKNVNLDFAFLTVRGDVQARAGAERIGYSSPVPELVRVEAYSLTGRLTVCSRRPGVVVEAGNPELTFACPGYASASSGGPFLAGINQDSGRGTIVGLIGGYQQGGTSPSLSYSSPFGQIIHRLYRSVISQPGESGARYFTLLSPRR